MRLRASPEELAVAAVVVTFNRRTLLSECLDALLAQTRALDAIYVIDNASTDGTAALLQGAYAGRVICEYLPQNLGGAGGFHVGMSRAFEDGHDWMWVMDDDVAPELQCLERLLAYRSQASTLIPLRVTRQMQIVEQAPLEYNLAKLFFTSPVKSRICTKYRSVSDLPPTLPVALFSFEGPLIKRTVIERKGLPRADFFIGGDDTEYALRIRGDAKTAALCVSGALMYRALPVNRPLDGWRRYYTWRNHFYIYRQYGETVLVRLWPIGMFVALIGKYLTVRKNRWHNLTCLWHAFWDAWKTVLPRRYVPS
jgi:rhamnopyranosyl-N-acetylglucosaminyl-diphospho-decaprenol beta-1,3/1,4-galactofuranosyltransferase